MISHPRRGQPVRLRYRPGLATVAPYHDRAGAVVIPAAGPGPLNHGVIVDARLVIVPRGHLVKPAAT